MLKMVDLVKNEEINATNTYHKLTKENSELLRRYCFYLKLKIQQLLCCRHPQPCNCNILLDHYNNRQNRTKI